jgi:hypothetical protein
MWVLSIVKARLEFIKVRIKVIRRDFVVGTCNRPLELKTMHFQCGLCPFDPLADNPLARLLAAPFYLSANWVGADCRHKNICRIASPSAS